MFDIEVTVKGMGSDHATAPSKRQAEKEAAALLLARLEKGIKS
jgi:dsRNA-specific ribonuclease